MEAAFLIPILMLTFMLLIQPGILLYVRMAMEGAAAEACRVVATQSSLEQGNNTLEAFVKRRLACVPSQENFHVHDGACSWKIAHEGNESSSEVRVEISGEVKPLPLFDFGMAALGILNERGNFVIRVERRQPTRTDWINESEAGTDPKQWIERWKDS